MGLLSERINTWVEDRITAWKERLRGWAVAVIELGLEAFLRAVEKAAAPHLKPFIERMEATGEVPDELKPIFKTLKEPVGAWPAMMALSLGSGMMGSAVGTLGDVMFGSMARVMMKKVTNRIMEVGPLIHIYRKGDITEADFYGWMAENGFDENWANWWLDATEFLPSWGDLIHWQAREVFEEAMVTKYGLDDEFETLDLSLFAKIGVTEEQAKNAWRAHWEHASWVQVVEMFRRGLITEQDLWDWFRLVEIPPFWRDKLIEVSHAWPTRVDVRRWWDMRTIDEAKLRELYAGMGYHGKNLDDYVLWTKVYVAFPDLMARWTKGWITLDDVRAELTGLGMPAERLEELIQTKIKATEAERTVKEKDLTKTDIIKGVKTEVITRDQGVELLMDLGYEEDEADYILAINIPREEQVSEVKTRELTKADILKGLKTEVLTELDAVAKLQELRYTLDDAQFIVKIFMASVKPPVEPRAKEASKADIVLAVKKGLITPEDGYLMLQDIGFTPEAAHFILTVRVEESPFSPVSYGEFKDLTHKWRRAAGREAKAMPEELKQAGAEMVRLTSELEALRRSIAEEEAKLIKVEVLPEAATKKRDKLRVALHRAEAELAQAKSRYDSLLAQWRHGG